MLEQTICDYCKKSDIPLTEEDSQEIFQRDPEGRKIVHAVVHRTCADGWVKAHSGLLIEDLEP